MPAGQWLKTWHAEYAGNVKPATAVKYEQDIELYIKPALGSILLQKLTASAIQKLYNDLRREGRKIPAVAAEKTPEPFAKAETAWNDGKERKTPKAPQSRPLSPVP